MKCHHWYTCVNTVITFSYKDIYSHYLYTVAIWNDLFERFPLVSHLSHFLYQGIKHNSFNFWENSLFLFVKVWPGVYIKAIDKNNKNWVISIECINYNAFTKELKFRYPFKSTDLNESDKQNSRLEIKPDYQNKIN